MIYARQKTEPSQVEPLRIVIEYIDGSEDKFEINYNREQLSQLFSTAMESGSGLNFSNINPPMTINPRHIKKVSFLNR
ncbi:hypothetical protein [Streptococcus salivarius]|uniref:hypothetical protein n=1 Tax=Streptococcus salivarius TaxID=1304 RepID=UPI00093D814F|nr:hypothetical protein [Streptococcus salivarius]